MTTVASQRISGRDYLNGFAYGYPPPARTLPHAISSMTNLNTVCESAKCPNHWECWSQGTATFMVAGDRCACMWVLRGGHAQANGAGDR